ncbi:bifunctional protein GlmU-like isoform X1 [Acanthochromis polyacanthus]|uniref:Bifunctional protein GlmU-like n=2 Tax=Acanthochromis polyacanthus TaxID=80966 RepID=A0A3Q1FLQ2_9TELE|nr:bifunctional protein GlmU-like isoform X1 [Acanthochromis polyacanthus]
MVLRAQEWQRSPGGGPFITFMLLCLGCCVVWISPPFFVTAVVSSAGAGSSLQVHAVRFSPGQELLGCLQAFVEERRLRAPFIITCVGSVTKATLRLASATATNANEVIHLTGRFEIVSFVGTLNPEAHLHISLADSEGKTIGGHVLGDLEIFTTAEVVVGEAVDLQFTRELDQQTGYPELVVRERSQTNLSA